MFSRIVVPLDGSHLAARALPQAEELARLTGASLHLVRALDPSHVAKLAGSPVFGTFMALTAFQQLVEEERTASEGYLAATKADLSRRGFTVTTGLLNGNRAAEIIAATTGGDLIVMATHGRGGLSRWFLGSVAEEVARHAAVPVMLIRTHPEAVESATAAGAEESTSRAEADGHANEPGSSDSGGDRNRALHLLHKDHYRPEEAAYLLGIDADVIYHAAFAKQLKAEIVGHDVVGIQRHDLIRWMERDYDDGHTRR